MKHTVLILLVGLSCAAQAQTFYRCGSTITDTPCPGAKTLHVDRDANVMPRTETPAPEPQAGIPVVEENQGHARHPTGYTISTPHGQFHSKTPMQVQSNDRGITIDGVTYQPPRRRR